MNLYKHPVVGHARIPFKQEMIEVSYQDTKDFYFKKIAYWKREDQIIFTNGKGKEIMQSCRAIRFVMCKPGEDNISAKLSNDQGLDIYFRAHDGEKSKDLAKEFDVTPDLVNSIKNLRARTSVTLNYLNDVKEVIPEKMIVARRLKNKKLSPSMANFIRKDNQQNKIPIKILAKKYCVSERTIQRIIKGQMYKNVQ